ncbi:MAG: thymidine kinase [Pseudomonadota bacterium]
MAKLYFNYSAMNAGKSTNLLQASFNYRERGMNTILFTAAIDTRSPEGRITSRIGLEAPAIPFHANTDIFEIVLKAKSSEPVDAVFLDEAQFLSPDQVRQLARIVDELGLPVLCYGLRTDFLGDLFPGAATLMALADDIRELKTICHCGRKATMNLRIDQNGDAVIRGDSIEIGGNDRYAALCRAHFYEEINKVKNRDV